MNYDEANTRWVGSQLPLNERSDYKKVWNKQAQDVEVATLAIVGARDAIDLERMARWTIEQLNLTGPITHLDVTLEIGCGIGRVGRGA